MAIKKLNPVTPGTRTRIAVVHTEVTTDKPYKKLTEGKRRTGGRNNEGHRTSRNRGGGHKRRYRIIDFKREKDGMAATVRTIEYDPNRSCYIALVEYTDGEKRYILAPNGLKAGSVIESGRNIAPEIGNCLHLEDMPIGTVVFAIELHPGRGASMARSAGTSAQVVGREGKYVIIRLPSGEMRKVLGVCKATVGIASNPDHSLIVLGKAGRNRWLGRRPRVRGVAMNPVDHPMGGGEGRASGGHPRSRNGRGRKGEKTRNPKKASNKLIIARRNVKANG